MTDSGKPRTRNAKLLAWVDEIAALAKPDAIYWCDGSQSEYEHFCSGMVEAGMMIPLN